MALTPPDSLTGLGRLDQYDVLGILGGGGMGYVLRARDGVSGQEVAIKLLKPELTHEPLAVQRFLREARHMQRLDHPHILRVHEVVPRDQGPYFVMDLVEGGSLAERLAREAPMTPARVLPIAKPVAQAIAHAHRKGLIHRDIKPGNVLVDGEGQAWLTDFGLARTLFNDTLVDVRLSQAAGTLPYMSPGRVQGLAEDTRTDIYAFGALLYEMLSGRAPYAGDTVEEVSREILAGPPAPIGNLKPELGPEWGVIIEGAMARDLRHRYASMDDVLADLERVERGETPQGPGVRKPDGNSDPKRQRILVRRLAYAGVAGAVLAALAPDAIRWLRDSKRIVEWQAFSVPGIYSFHDANLVRWSGMPQPLLCVAQDDRIFHVSLEGKLLGNPHLGDVLAEHARVGDSLLNAEGTQQQVLVSWRAGSTLNAAALDFAGTELRRFQFEPLADAPNGSAGSLMQVRQVVDLDGDDRRELLATVGSVQPPAPGTLVCFDFETGDLQWQRLQPAPITGFQVADLDGDGTQEILLAFAAGAPTQVSENQPPQVAPPGIKACDAAGNERWRWQPSGPCSQVYLLVDDLDEDGAADVLVWTGAVPGDAAFPGSDSLGEIVRLASDGTLLHRRAFESPLQSCLVASLEASGPRTVLATDGTGNLHSLDRELGVLKAVDLVALGDPGSFLRLQAVWDLDRDGRPEIVLDRWHEETVSPSGADGTELRVQREAHYQPTLLIVDSDLTLRDLRLVSDVEYVDRGTLARVELVDLEEPPGVEVVYLLQNTVYVFGYGAAQ